MAEEKNLRSSGRLTYAKALTISAIGMGVGFGTCSIAGVTTAGQGEISPYFIWTGAILFFVSFAFLILTALVALIDKLVRSFRK